MTSGAEWATRVGDVWADEWRRTDRTFAGLAPALDAAIDAQVSQDSSTALDVGCGAGSTSLALARRWPGLTITGLDISQRLAAVATARAEADGLANARFVAGNAAAPPALDPFDLIVSRHGVMFFDDPVAAFAALRAAARPGAALVFSCFRPTPLNPWVAELVECLTGKAPTPPTGYAPSPFAFADRAFTLSILEAAGWCDADTTIVDYDYLAGEGDDPIADAVRTFSLIGPVASILAAADPAARGGMVDRLRAALEPYHADGRVALPAAAWIWTARA
ncbi:class I SAM-dependent methyltransferase [Sphingomonas nostoxanthinifaciens]|uniref:class I SAM-dependent methyltransferase n=1 Tax=Sphingomonas nostoxanthinifaciens TaxID=2872652 RepID=UPI001CC21500|nr:class I SAM-dependent methyltransferase [Sphingomonas nostoxanthinifaciens]UAK26157.1 class I SAM-dependent methyltransferase [Sphingomonas nostoxanthinifaciens]